MEPIFGSIRERFFSKEENVELEKVRALIYVVSYLQELSNLDDESIIAWLTTEFNLLGSTPIDAIMDGRGDDLHTFLVNTFG